MTHRAEAILEQVDQPITFAARQTGYRSERDHVRHHPSPALLHRDVLERPLHQFETPVAFQLRAFLGQHDCAFGQALPVQRYSLRVQRQE